VLQPPLLVRGKEVVTTLLALLLVRWVLVVVITTVGIGRARGNTEAGAESLVLLLLLLLLQVLAVGWTGITTEAAAQLHLHLHRVGQKRCAQLLVLLVGLVLLSRYRVGLSWCGAPTELILAEKIERWLLLLLLQWRLVVAHAAAIETGPALQRGRERQS
jgi:hypothetical protein